MLSSHALYEPNEESSSKEQPSSPDDELQALHQAFKATCEAAPARPHQQRKKKLTLTLVVRHNLDNLSQLKHEKNYTYEEMSAMLMKAYPFLQKEIKATSLKTIFHRELAKKLSPKDISPQKPEKRQFSSPQNAPNNYRSDAASTATTRGPRRVLDNDPSQVASRNEFNIS
ncbi:hypothetical protein H6F89_34460 [Cyanobacteria bacterium FACHB-63]|nr:hypothetical protein [Cyanobacteria bacterium FACHB-63]